jgi:hypothetical protein
MKRIVRGLSVKCTVEVWTGYRSSPGRRVVPAGLRRQYKSAAVKAKA